VTQSYGSWPSPLSAAVLAEGGVRVGGIARRGDETWWSELRPAEAGRSVLVRHEGACTPAGTSSAATDVLAEPWSARTRVHEYGGGAWWLGASSAYFANWTDQRLYRLDQNSTEPVPLTPEPPTPAGWRFADGREHPTDGWVVCVRERHEPVRPDASSDSPPEAVNELVAIPVTPSGSKSGHRGDATALPEPTILGSGPDAALPEADFVAAPRFSSDGRWLSWIRWDHPRMPWDGTQLCVAPVFGGMRLGNVQVVAGGDHEAIHGADWTTDGRLVFSTDRSGFWNLHEWTPGSDQDRPLTRLAGAEIGGPQWVFGVQRWVELSDGRLVAVVTSDATDRLVLLDGGGLTDIPSPFVEIEAIAATDDGTVIVQGETATTLTTIVELGAAGELVATLRPPDEIGVDDAWFSRAESVHYRSGPDGEREAQAFIYRPTGPVDASGTSELPPLVVMGHGGPTAHSSPALNLRVQYWTSRGFVVADVNYGGSSGFGRQYRRLLDDAWGIVDVEDCIAIAQRLAADGVVDPARMAIRGGSAGGFTVLRALTSSTVFSAGTNLFGVADLEALARDTHKFESRYLDGLIGPYPERRDIYEERSPINHTDELSCPLLVLQGLEDEIVPPNQSEAIVAALADKGIPHAYVPFDGEQHGFRQEVNIIRSYEVELWFYGRVFGFVPADPIEPPVGAVGL
jgi:dipeptidyl aminopeptidase/acylaminoacyl peptidase